MGKFTPGPWEVMNNFVKKIGGAVIATTSRNNAAHRYEAGVGSVEDAANAKLIAMAPEMYEAIRLARVELHTLAMEKAYLENRDITTAREEATKNYIVTIIDNIIAKIEVNV